MPARSRLAGVGVDGMSRGAFLVRGALSAGAVAGVGAVGPFVASALAAGQEVTVVGGPGSKSDLEIMQFALTLEELEADFYRQALDRVSLSPRTGELVALIGRNEDDHVEKLRTAIELLGGEPAKAPKFHFPLSDERSFLELAKELEETGVGAYDGVARQLRSMPLLEVAGGIVQVEARHAGAIRRALGESPTPAFAEALERDEVTKRIGDYMDKGGLMPLADITIAGWLAILVVGGVLGLVILARLFSSGSGSAELLDFRPDEHAEIRAELDAEDLYQMMVRENERRRAQGRREITEAELDQYGADALRRE